MGCNQYPGTGGAPEWMIARFDNDRYTAFGAVVPGNPYVIANTGNYTGFFTGTANGTTTIYRNGSSLASASKTYGAANNMIALCALNHPGNSPGDFSSREYAFFSIGLYLDGTETSNFNTCVATFQTTLGRNV
jgi:hypothetical protein